MVLDLNPPLAEFAGDARRGGTPTYTSTSSAHQQSRSGEIGKPEGTKKLKAPHPGKGDNQVTVCADPSINNY